MIEELEKILWSQYPVDQYVRIDGDYLHQVIVYIEKLEKDLFQYETLTR